MISSGDNTDSQCCRGFQDGLDDDILKDALISVDFLEFFYSGLDAKNLSKIHTSQAPNSFKS